MRKSSAVACFVLIVGISLSLSIEKNPARGQENEPAPATSSRDLGRPFDRQAIHQFEQQLSPQDRARLVRLNSRYALPAAACPLPEDPSQPFYLKLRKDMTRELADRLAAAGVSFIGYANPHTHILRAADAGSLQAAGEIIRTDPLVIGTLLQQPEDKLDWLIADFALGEANHAGDYHVLFWRDVTAEQAVELLEQARASLIEGTVDAAGNVDLDTPYVSVSVDKDGFAMLLRSNLVEHLTWMGVTETDNQTSTVIANADMPTMTVNPYNLDGSGQIVGVWDEGPARDTHNDFQNAPSPNPFGIGSKRVLKVDTSTVSNHGTHVTGTIVGDGTADTNIHSTTGQPEARGYAYNALALSHNWSNVDQQRRNAKHNWNHVADNHSYSTRQNYGGYSGSTAQKDFTNRDYFLLMCQSAGNYATASGRPFSDGTMTVYASNAHRNGLVIANAQDNENINNSSSRGPAQDGRLVPQFTANGTGLRSPINSSGDSGYASYTGTSMSSPSVCGSLVLLAQLWRREHNDRCFAPDTARAVLALTCRDKYHPGPDYRYGFGMVDVKAAADLILADKANNAQIIRGAVRSGGSFEYPVNVVSSSEPLRVVLSWLDVYASTSASITLVNDLDVELVDPTGTVVHYPYSGVTSAVANGDETYVFTTTGPNTRDNIELVHVDNPAVGTWTLRVKGTSIPANPQTGFSNDVQGYVLTSSHQIGAQQLKFEDSINGNTPVSIPDNTVNGVTRSFTVNDSRVITGVRLVTRIIHHRRGDLEIILQHPNSTQVTLKSEDSGPEDDYTDIIGVFPDTRQPDDDVTALMCLPVQGTWQIFIRDRASGNTGQLEYLSLELDVRVNNAPVADAGSSFTVREAANGSMDGSGSNDPDADPITYLWTQTSGVAVNLGSSTVAQPTFTAPSVSQDEVVTFDLTVTDCAGAMDTDSVQFTILNNQAPVADAGVDFDVRELQSGQLDASGSSDPESDPLTYAWVQTGGAITLSLSSATAQQPTFNVPALTQDEVVTFQVTVTDDRNDSDTDTVQVTLRNNLAPQASAGADFGILEGLSGQLDGSATTDPENDAITYAWVQTGGGVTLALSSAAVAQPSFTAPAVTQNEVLTFVLTATDSYGDSTADTVQVTIEVNLPPVADAGPNLAVTWAGTVQLDGSGSFDPNGGDTITYLWVQVGGTNVVALSDATAAQPTFQAPAVDDTLEFELTVMDSKGLVDMDVVRVYVNETGTLPKSSSGGGDGGGGGCSTHEDRSLWLLAVLLGLVAAVRLRRRTE